MRKHQQDLQSDHEAKNMTEKEVTYDNAISIPVIEEKAKIEKQVVESATVRIEKKVYEEDVLVDVPLEHDEMEVKRIPINQYVQTSPPAMRYEGETMIISVLKEVVVTEKRLLLVEELRVTKRKVKTNTQEKVTLRKEEVTVKRMHPKDAQPTSDAD